jgi:hypothetical protein
VSHVPRSWVDAGETILPSFEQIVAVRFVRCLACVSEMPTTNVGLLLFLLWPAVIHVNVSVRLPVHVLF